VELAAGLASVTRVGPKVEGSKVEGPKVERIADGMYMLDHDGRNEIVYVVTSANDRWLFWDGHVFRIATGAKTTRHASQAAAPSTADPRAAPSGSPSTNERSAPSAQSGTTRLTAPMPARIVSIDVAAGSRVEKGQTIVVLEAMKMELPVRAPDAAVVVAVHCSEGEMVAADAPLVDLFG
jgi:biotin carboxyl carrier protein